MSSQVAAEWPYALSCRGSLQVLQEDVQMLQEDVQMVLSNMHHMSFMDILHPLDHKLLVLLWWNRAFLTDKFNGEEENYESMAGGEICWTSPRMEILCSVSWTSWRGLSDADTPQGFLASELT